MNQTWRELSPNDSWSVVTERPLETAAVGVLVHLYQPIIGTDSVSLYMTLCMQGGAYAGSQSSPCTHRFLMNLLSLPLDQVLEARRRLEGVGLLKTYERREELGRSFQYEVIPPLEPRAFFQTDVLSITLMNRLGKERFRQVRERFCPEGIKERDGFENVTKKFNDVFTSITASELTVRDESEYQPLLAELETASAGEAERGPSFDGYELDWDFLKAQASPVGSIDHLTKEDRDQIRQWAFFYQLDVVALGKALQNPVLYDERNELQLEELHSYIKQEYRYRHGHPPDIRQVNAQRRTSSGRETEDDPSESVEEKHRRWLAKLSPLELLERYQRGGKVPEADVQLVEELVETYGLPFAVVNVLIEYVLLTNDYKLPRSLVEKMAGHWKRANVQTVEEAQELALKQLYRRERPKSIEIKNQKRRTAQRQNRAESNGAKKPPAESEESRRKRQVKFEQLLGKLQQARSRGE